MISQKIIRVFMFLLSMTSVMFISMWNSNNDLMQMVKPFFKLPNGILDGNIEPIEKKYIFFLETSTSAIENFNLSVRQACSVESAAKTNPGMQIYLLILSNATFSPATREKINILLTYKNIAIRRITIEDYLKNTPIEEWWKTGIMNTSKYLAVHTSDIFRLVTLWKFGGIYLDLDMIVMKSLENMTNFVAIESNDAINNAALGFSATAEGKKIVDILLQDLKENFDGQQWAQQGPFLMTRVLQKLCGTSISDTINNKTCQGLHVYPASSFYPIHWSRWELLFDEANCSSIMSELNESFGIHFWNKLSAERVVKVGSQSAYVTLVSEYCPRIYNSLDGFF